MAIYELDGQKPELPADGRYWVAETATRDRARAAHDRRQHLVRLGAARRQ